MSKNILASAVLVLAMLAVTVPAVASGGDDNPDDGSDLGAAAECGSPCTISSSGTQELQFNDTDVANDWEIETFSDSGIFQIGRTSAGNEAFQIFSGAPDDTLVLDELGRVGIGTTTPAAQLGVKSSGSGVLFRLENGPGDAAQLRRTGGRFEIQVVPAGAVITANEEGSITAGGGFTPQARLHVRDTDEARHERVLGRLTGSNFAPQFEYEDGSTGDIWREGMNPSGHFVINQTDDLSVAELRISPDGEVFVNGSQAHPDYVFDADYELMDLQALQAYIAENGHLPGVLSSERAQGQVNLSSLPLQLLEKVEELTLYTLQQEERISDLEARLADLEALVSNQ